MTSLAESFAHAALSRSMEDAINALAPSINTRLTGVAEVVYGTESASLVWESAGATLELAVARDGAYELWQSRDGADTLLIGSPAPRKVAAELESLFAAA